MDSSKRPRVLGLNWRKFQKMSAENEKNQEDKQLAITENNSVPPLDRTATIRRTLSRMKSVRIVRDAFGTIRQKLRTSTRRRKRLINASPYTPKHGTTTFTPSSAQRRSLRIAKHQEEKMYSPFTVDTPSKTPSKIRMGVHEPKRYGRYFSPSFNPLEFNFSSPGQLTRDVNNLADGIRTLTEMGNQLNKAADRRSGIRTTPKGIRTTPRRTRNPVFV